MVKLNFCENIESKLFELNHVIVGTLTRKRFVAPRLTQTDALGKGVYSQLGNMHWKVDEHLKYLTNFPKIKHSLEI